MTTPTLFPEIETTTRVCVKCGEEKHISEFHKNNTSWNGKQEHEGERYRKECKECRKPNSVSDAGSGKDVMKYHNLSRPPLGTPCDICSRTDVVLFCDHDHSKEISDPEVFRGWLCHKCNTSLGCLGDNEEGILKVLEYLRRPATIKYQPLTQ